MFDLLWGADSKRGSGRVAVFPRVAGIFPEGAQPRGRADGPSLAEAHRGRHLSTKEVSMKKFLTGVSSAALVLAATVAVAQQNQPRQNPPANPPQTDQAKPSDANANAGTFEGTITQIDQSGKSFVVRDVSGTDVTITWDQATRLMGSETSQGTTTDRSGQTSSSMSGLKVGDEVVVKTTDQGGKKVAAAVRVKPKKS